MKGLNNWVWPHPYNFSQMVQIVVEHFRETVVPLPKFGREREGVALSQVKLTHHNQKNRGKLKMYLHDKDSLHLDPISEAGSVAVQEKQKDRLSEIIEKVNAPFTGELTENDKLVYVNNVILGKLLESETLAKQQHQRTVRQFPHPEYRIDRRHHECPGLSHGNEPSRG